MDKLKSKVAEARQALSEIEKVTNKGPQHRAQIAIVEAFEALIEISEQPKPEVSA